MDQSPKVEQESYLPTEFTSLPSPLDLLKDAFNRFKKYYSRLFPILGAFFIASLAIDITNYANGTWLRLLMGIIGTILYLISLVALFRTISDLESDPNDFGGLITRSSKQVLSYLWISILLSVVTLGGFALLIVPGIILAVLLSQAVFVFILEDVRGVRALIQSWQYVKGRWWEVFVRIVILILIMLILVSVLYTILGICGIGPVADGTMPFSGLMVSQLFETFLVVPFAISFMFIFYSALKGTMGPIMEHEEQTARTWVSISLAIGLIVTIVLPVAFTVAFAVLVAFLKAGGVHMIQQAIGASSTASMFQ